VKKLKIFLAVGVLSIGATASIMSTPASAAGNIPPNKVKVGGIDMVGACSRQHGSAFRHAVLVRHNVMGWRCQNDSQPNSLLKHLDLDIYACQRVYGSGMAAYYEDFNNPFTWGCYI
jgi:hypothetical protein